MMLLMICRWVISFKFLPAFSPGIGEVVVRTPVLLCFRELMSVGLRRGNMLCDKKKIIVVAVLLVFFLMTQPGAAQVSVSERKQRLKSQEQRFRKIR